MADKSRPSRAALKTWLNGAGRTQPKLAKAIGVRQQTVSALLHGRAPSPELAKLIDAATLGEVSWKGWFTARELERFDKRLERARRLGALLAASPAP